MTEQEIRALLIAAMAYDNRKPGDATVAAWLEAAGRARWTFEAALDALHSHYAESSDWVMPGHITARIRTTRTGPAPVAELLALDAPPPAAAETRMDIVRRFAGTFGIPGSSKRAVKPPRNTAEHAAQLAAARAELDRIRGESP